jgi:phage-related protein
MVDVFAFKIRAEPSGQVTYRKLTAQFGDGYSQAAADGINNRLQVWNIEARGPWLVPGCLTGQPVKSVADFLDATEGYTSFDWMPPDSTEAIRVGCDGYSLQKMGNGITTLSAVFKQVYR